MDSRQRAAVAQYLDERFHDLATDYGVWNNDLAKRLGAGLCRHFRFDGREKPDKIRNGLIERLREYVLMLQPPQGKSKKRRFFHSVGVSFNIENYPELEDVELKSRWLWVAKRTDELYVSKESSQRYLDRAIKQIVDRILDEGYEPEEAAATDSAAAPELELALATTAPLPPLLPPFRAHTALRLTPPPLPQPVQALPAPVGAKRGGLARSKLVRAAKITSLLGGLAAVGAAIGGLLLPLVYRPSLVWEGPSHNPSAFAIASYRPIAALSLALTLPVLWLLIVHLRRRRTLICVAEIGSLAATLIFPLCFFGGVEHAHHLEAKDAQEIYSQVGNWELSALDFDSIVDGDRCDQKFFLPSQWAREPDGAGCIQGDGVVALSSYLGSISALHVNGREILRQDGDFYAEALLRPSERAYTPWQGCGIGVAPGSNGFTDIARISFPNFVLVRAESKDSRGIDPLPPYHYVIEVREYQLAAMTGDVKQSGRISIPYTTDGQPLTGSPKDGWLKLGILQQGREYRVFVNDHLVLTYIWPDKPPLTYPQIESYGHTKVSSSTLGTTASGDRPVCKFDYFKVWTETP